MANMFSSIIIEQQRRRADIKITRYANIARATGEPVEGSYPGYVLGLFEVREGTESSDALFVCELADGQCVYRSVDSVVFNRNYEDMPDDEYEQYIQSRWEAR